MHFQGVIQKMISEFDIQDVNKSASRINTGKLLWLNQEYLKNADNSYLISLLNNLNYQFIIYLIELNFKITIKDIEIALKDQNIYLVEHLSRKFNNT